MTVESPDVPWARNHDERGVPPRFDALPSRAAMFFHSFLGSSNIRSGSIADLGCGNGRNAVYFAQSGFEVHAIDCSEDAVDGLDRYGVYPYCQDLAECWLFGDSAFDLAMDVFCYSQEPDKDRRLAYRRELMRTLKPEGYFLLAVPAMLFPKTAIEKEFAEFLIVASDETVESIAGGRVKTLNFVMKKR